MENLPIVDFDQLVVVENATTRQANFVLPVAFTLDTWIELVDASPERRETRLFDLLFAAKCAARVMLQNGLMTKFVSFEYECLPILEGPRALVTCQVGLVQGKDGEIGALFRLPENGV